MHTLERSASPAADWLDRELYPFQSRWVDVGGHRIHHPDEGRGPTRLPPAKCARCGARSAAWRRICPASG